MKLFFIIIATFYGNIILYLPGYIYVHTKTTHICAHVLHENSLKKTFYLAFFNTMWMAEILLSQGFSSCGSLWPCEGACRQISCPITFQDWTLGFDLWVWIKNPKKGQHLSIIFYPECYKIKRGHLCFFGNPHNSFPLQSFPVSDRSHDVGQTPQKEQNQICWSRMSPFCSFNTQRENIPPSSVAELILALDVEDDVCRLDFSL